MRGVQDGGCSRAFGRVSARPQTSHRHVRTNSCIHQFYRRPARRARRTHHVRVVLVVLREVIVVRRGLVLADVPQRVIFATHQRVSSTFSKHLVAAQGSRRCARARVVSSERRWQFAFRVCRARGAATTTREGGERERRITTMRRARADAERRQQERRATCRTRSRPRRRRAPRGLARVLVVGGPPSAASTAGTARARTAGGRNPIGSHYALTLRRSHKNGLWPPASSQRAAACQDATAS